jgi:hypothetical protein
MHNYKDKGNKRQAGEITTAFFVGSNLIIASMCIKWTLQKKNLFNTISFMACLPGFSKACRLRQGFL